MYIGPSVGVLWFASIILAGWYGNERDRTLLGFILGLLLGPFGVIVICLMQRTPEQEARYQLEVDRYKAILRESER